MPFQKGFFTRGQGVKITLNIFAVQAASYVDTSIRALSWNNYIACSRMIKSFYLWNFLKTLIIQSNLAIRNFLVALKLFLDVKIFLSLWSKCQIGHRKWFLNTNLFLIKLFLIAKFDCIEENEKKICQKWFHPIFPESYMY